MNSISMLPLPSSAPSGLEIRELTSAEIATMEHLFREAGTVLPDPATSTFIGALEGGKVVGFLTLQVKLHAEPMWIEPGYSHVFRRLVSKAEETILARVGPTWVYAFTPAGKVSQLAASMGMQPEPFVIMSKLVMPEPPAKPSVGEIQFRVPAEVDMDKYRPSPSEGDAESEVVQ